MASNPTAAPVLFDRALLRVRQNRARRGEPATFLLDRVAEDIEERLHAVLREFADAADIWTPGEILRKPSRDRFKSVTQISLDETGQEILPLQPESLDLAVSALAFQFVNDLPGVLAQIRRALRPDGLLLAAMLGGDTLTELRQCFRGGGSRMRGRRVAARCAVCRSARCRRAVATRGLCAAGHRRRSRGGALRQRVCADA